MPRPSPPRQGQANSRQGRWPGRRSQGPRQEDPGRRAQGPTARARKPTPPTISRRVQRVFQGAGVDSDSRCRVLGRKIPRPIRQGRRRGQSVRGAPGGSECRPPRRGKAERRAHRLATLKAGQVGEVTVSGAALGAQLSVDGIGQPGPLPIVLKLAPGPHKLTLSAPGFDPEGRRFGRESRHQTGTKGRPRAARRSAGARAPA